MDKWATEPGVTQLALIHQFFGISIDSLVLSDLTDGKVITDEHVKQFKSTGKVSWEVIGKVKALSKAYLTGDDDSRSVLNDPSEAYNLTIIGQLKVLSDKVDKIAVFIGKNAK